MIPWLYDTDVEEFPPIDEALDEPNGLLCAGGTLSADSLLKAYRLGIFPWYSDPDPILWWSPDPRSVIVPAEIHISKSMKKILKRNPFTVTCDRQFRSVMLCCAEPRNYTSETWITDEMITAYCELHERGFAHSVEVWEQNRLAGGLYGVAIGSVFFGESMFSRSANASKTGFILLADALHRSGFGLIDCQLRTRHLDSLGARQIDRNEFKNLLHQLTNIQPKSSPWDMLNSKTVSN